MVLVFAFALHCLTLYPLSRINASFGSPWNLSVVHSVCVSTIREPGCHIWWRMRATRHHYLTR